MTRKSSEPARRLSGTIGLDVTGAETWLVETHVAVEQGDDGMNPTEKEEIIRAFLAFAKAREFESIDLYYGQLDAEWLIRDFCAGKSVDGSGDDPGDRDDWDDYSDPDSW